MGHVTDQECTSSRGGDAFRRLLAGEDPGYVPLYDSVWGDTLRAWVDQGYPVDDAGQPVSPVEHFGFDQEGAGGWFTWTAGLEDEIVEETDEWKLVRNGNGAVLRWWKGRSGTPEHVEFAMTDRTTWERDYRPHLLGDVRSRLNDLARMRERAAAVRRSGRCLAFGCMAFWEMARASLGDIGMFMALADDKEWIRDFNRVYADLYLAAYRVYFDEVGVPDCLWVYEDLGYRDRLFCHPDMLAELYFPCYAEIVAFAHSHGVPVVLHSCGYQEPMIPLAIAAGFDALNPMEVKAGNDLLAYAERFGEDLAFVGGFDARILERGDRDEIRAAVAAMMTGMRERGARFVFGSDHSLSSAVTYQAFSWAVEAYRELAEG